MEEANQELIDGANKLAATIKDVVEALSLIGSSPHSNCIVCDANRVLAQRMLIVFKERLMEYAAVVEPIRKH